MNHPDREDAGASAELVATRRELAATKAELGNALESHRAFAYSVSHDLRAPLRAIAGFVGMLEETPLEELSSEARRFLDIIRDNARLMNAQIDGLLALFRLEHGPLNPTVVDVTAVAQTAVAQVRADEPTRDLRVTLGALPPATADPDLLRVALVELLKNAWKFTRDLPAAAVEIGSELHGSDVAYFVRDNGVGFAAGSAGQLFTAFRRLHGAKEYEGLGLGLATVKAIVMRHHGAVWAESQPGRSTTVYFRIPARSSATDEQQPPALG